MLRRRNLEVSVNEVAQLLSGENVVLMGFTDRVTATIQGQLVEYDE